MDWLIVFILVRAVERLAIVIIAGLCMWMGWQLFLRLPRRDQQAEFGYKDITVKLLRVGPGVFFALFGAALLGATFWHLPKADDAASLQPIATGQSSPPNSPARHLELASEANPADLEAQVVALNVTLSVAQLKPDEPLAVIDRTRLGNAKLNLEILRNRLLSDRFGRDALAQWLAYRNQYRVSPPSVPAEVRESVKNVEELANRLNTKT
jgi:hypothetical protein